jgi:hypothetical protein
MPEPAFLVDGVMEQKNNRTSLPEKASKAYRM